MKVFKILGVFLLLITLFNVLTPVYANGVFDDITNNPFADNYGGSGASDTAKAAAKRVWYILRNAINLIALGVIVFAGIRYMAASADQKADLKKSLGTLAIGAAIVFGSLTIIQFIVDIANEVF